MESSADIYIFETDIYAEKKILTKLTFEYYTVKHKK